MPAPGAENASRLLERVAEIYARTFLLVPDGRACLERRGIADMGVLDRHGVGYADGRLIELLPQDGKVREELRRLGVLLDRVPAGAGPVDQERLAGCVVFPVRDVNGQVTTLCGVPGGPEAVPCVYLPGRPCGLWNAVAMNMYPELILTGTIMDALSVMVAGHGNVLAAPWGGVGDSEIDGLKTQGMTAVRLLPTGGQEAGGGDTGGLLARFASRGIAAKVMALPGGRGANEWLLAQGAGRLAALLASAGPSSGGRATASSAPAGGSPPGEREGILLVCGPRRYEVRGLEKGPRRLKATIRAERGGKLHVDTLDFYSAKSRRGLALDLCRVFEEPVEAIGADLEKLVRHCEALPENPSGGVIQADAAAGTMSAAERKEADAFGKSPTLIEDIVADFETCGLVGERTNKLLAYLAMTSRKTDDPLSVLIVSSSGAGKTALQDKVLAFCPPEDLVKLTSLSGKALFYKEQMSLRHKVLSLEEGAGAAGAGYAIRNLITAGELVIEAAIKDKATGRITTMTNRVEGPTSVFITTTDPDTDAETRSRFFVTGIDESREQTRAILSFQRWRHALGGLADREGVAKVLGRHRNFQRLLRPLGVVNPYAEQLTYGDDRLQGRRDQPKYLNLIKAVAFLRQGSKPVMTSAHGRDYIRVELEDIRLANELATEILGMSLDELSTPGRDLLLQIEAMVQGRLPEGASREAVIFSRREVREFSGWANARVHRYLRELVDFEHVVRETGRNGVTCRYRLVWDGQGRDGRRFIPGAVGLVGLGLKPVEDLEAP